MPSRVHYQGFLADSAGAPIHCSSAADCPSGPTDLTFRLYAAATGGEATWEETHASVALNSGVFNVTLGLTNALDATLLDAEETFLGIAVNGADELQPRQQVISSPFALVAARAGLALVAEDAAALGGQPAEVFVTVDQIPDLCVTDAELAILLAASQYMTPVDVGIFLNEQGYVTGPHLSEDDLFNILVTYGFAPGPYFSGHFGDLEGVPEDLADGDDDTLAALPCGDGQIARWDGDDEAWTCADDVILTEEDVDEMVANNGFAMAGAAPPVGSIVAFHPHVSDPPLQVPAGWVPCDGSAITDPTAYEDGGIGAGQSVGTLFSPDLNSATGDGLKGRFLRGHGTSGLTEESVFTSHLHSSGALVTTTDGDHAHVAGGLNTASAGAHTHASGGLVTAGAGHDHSTSTASNSFSVALNTLGDGDDKWALQPGAISVASVKATGGANQHTHGISGSTASAGGHAHAVGGSTGTNGNHGHVVTGDTATTGAAETRPAGFSVVWIMRVY